MITRHTAREIAIHFIFSYAFNKENPESFVETNITKENFLSLKPVEELSDIYGEFPVGSQSDYIKSAVSGVISKIDGIDALIEKYSLGWKLSRISKITISILRLAIYEITEMKDIPTSVSINEAVEFAKQYDSEENASFINGILGSFVRGDKSANEEAVEVKAQDESAEVQVEEQSAEAQVEEQSAEADSIEEQSIEVQSEDESVQSESADDEAIQ